jgi:hypothetical protein
MIILGLLIFTVNASDPKVSSWKSTPDILLCSDSSVNIKDLSIAIDFWEQRGFRFGKISKEDNCDDYHRGYIKFIGDEDLESGYLGMTEIYEYGNQHKTIASAYIEISDRQSDNLILLAHELGHSLGYNHGHNKNSVMYSNIKQVNIKIRR